MRTTRHLGTSNTNPELSARHLATASGGEPACESGLDSDRNCWYAAQAAGKIW
jgi:hypothetical protein